MKYKINEVAKRDLMQIADYGDNNFGEVQSNAYGQALERRFQEIALSPYLYPQVDHIKEGYRRSVFRSHQIYYVITDESTVKIMRVIGQQNFP